jgi:succinoglycan biosynthesis protein ExoL
MANTGVLKILLLAHDLSDAAVHRRVSMLREGGAVVTVAGFRRTPQPVARVAGCAAVNFGRTYDAGFAQRVWSIVREIVLLARHRALFLDADIIVARNLEMLAIAARGRGMKCPASALVYECLDIHRLLLRRDMIGAALRKLEGWLARPAAALITSSPAFVSEYFDVLSNAHLPVRLVENKVLDVPAPALEKRDTARQPGPPWVIGWFGVIRCKKSLRILTELARQGKGTIEVVIRGRPAQDQFEDFEKSISATPGLHFFGPYKNPDDLAAMYRGVHFNWAIDMFEEGLNSPWLLPNRLYEGGLLGAVPIAIESVETGAFLKRLGIGVTIREPLGRSLASFFRGLTPAHYRAFEEAVLNVPRSTWVYDKENCKALVDYLRSFSGDTHG